LPWAVYSRISPPWQPLSAAATAIRAKISGGEPPQKTPSDRLTLERFTASLKDDNN
jgi:hypothetical protein